MASDDTNEGSTDVLYQDHYALARSESQENAHRLMDDLELLRAERVASNQEKQEAARHRSRSAHRRHHPEAQPDDAFDTLTREPQVPQVKPEKKPTLVGKLFKEIKRFPRVIRYFVYVSGLQVMLIYKSTYQHSCWTSLFEI